MMVLTLKAERELVGVRFAEHVRTGVEKLLHDRCGFHRRVVRVQPRRAAESGLVPGNVVDVLHAEGQARKRPLARSFARYVGVPRESAELIALEYLVVHRYLPCRRCSSSSSF